MNTIVAAAWRPRLRRNVAWPLVLAMAAAAAVALPAYAGLATQRLGVEVLTLFTVALAWNLLAGYGGLVVVGQHAFIGVGAYALFAISNGLQLNPWLALPLAGISCAAFAVLTARPMFRLTGSYFAVGTWVMAEILRIVALNNPGLGAGGGMPLELIGEFDRATRSAGVYWAALAVAALALASAVLLLRGRWGLALTSIRDSESAAEACGVPVMRAKRTLWVMSAVMTGLAGAVYYMNTLQVSPDASFNIQWTASAIFIAVLGGIGTLEGPILGVIVYFVLRQYFAEYGNWYFIGLGALAMLTMLVAPGGAWRAINSRLAADPFRLRRQMPRPGASL